LKMSQFYLRPSMNTIFPEPINCDMCINGAMCGTHSDFGRHAEVTCTLYKPCAMCAVCHICAVVIDLNNPKYPISMCHQCRSICHQSCLMPGNHLVQMETEIKYVTVGCCPLMGPEAHDEYKSPERVIRFTEPEPLVRTRVRKEDITEEDKELVSVLLSSQFQTVKQCLEEDEEEEEDDYEGLQAERWVEEVLEKTGRKRSRPRFISAHTIGFR
jgi:hypothetical protein